MSSAVDKVVEVKAQGAELCDIDELVHFQGDLKRLTKENYEKLKGIILRHGFSEPISVWKNRGKIYVLNGHQRLNVLRGMRADGYMVPKIPINVVEAKDKKEAKEKVLALTSQYGEITMEGLSDFMIEAELQFDFIEENIRFPEIDFDLLKESDLNVQNTSKELNSNEFSEFDHKCPKCGFEWND